MKMNMNEKNTTEKKKRKIKGPLLIALAALLIFSGVGYAYVHSLLNSTVKEEIPEDNSSLGIGSKDFEYDDSKVEVPQGTPETGDLPFYYEEVKGITTIALFGVDAPIGKRGRSDAIMLVTVDRNTKKIKLTSIIRDSYVNIPGRGMDKINHAYAYGGPELALKTLNSNFHLDIKNFATVNFTTLPEIIDILDGVKISVTDAEASKIPGLTKGGIYTLTGDQALAYSRIRKIDSDFVRAERQRTVMEAIIKKMLVKPVTSYPGILGDLFPLVTTNLSSNDILSIAGSVVTNGIKTVEQNRYPEDTYSKGQKINGVYYYVFNRDSAVRSIGKYLYLDERSTSASN